MIRLISSFLLVFVVVYAFYCDRFLIFEHLLAYNNT